MFKNINIKTSGILLCIIPINKAYPKGLDHFHMPSEHMSQGDTPFHEELSGIKDSWKGISNWLHFPVWPPV